MREEDKKKREREEKGKTEREIEKQFENIQRGSD
jgi:hypothetical protein